MPTAIRNRSVVRARTSAATGLASIVATVGWRWRPTRSPFSRVGSPAEHGGFYRPSDRLYEHGLDVTLKMGGPQVNSMQLLLAGETDVMIGPVSGSSGAGAGFPSPRSRRHSNTTCKE